MKIQKHHTTFALLTVFFTGLFVIWWADYAEIPTESRRRQMVDRVLPDLIDVPPIAYKRLEIDRGAGGRLAFVRREGPDWQMVEPIDAAADRSMVETLAMNLKGLRKSPDAGTIEGPDSSFGLAPPSATIRVFGDKTKTPLATLAVGLRKGDLLYVREPGAPGIEVVDARRLNMLDAPASDWREKALFTIPSFRVGTLAVTGPGRDFKAERDAGKWTILRPFRALANEEKFEGVVAELTNLRVADGPRGFIADGVKDGAPYGLDTPPMTVELTPVTRLEKPQTLLIGKPVPDHPDRFYARRSDQDDVVAVEIKDQDVRDLGLNPNAVRSQKVTDFDPGRANLIRVASSETVIEVVKTPAGWALTKPAREKADAASVQSFLSEVNALQTSAFLDPTAVSEPGLDPPNLSLRIWQPDTGEKATREPGSEPVGEPRVAMRIGRYDALRKLIFARLDGDRTILTLPEPFLDVLPKNTLAFRDKTMLSLQPGQLQRLTIHREGKTFELAAPGSGAGAPTGWRMKAPVDAAADDEAATRMTLTLANLRAESLAAAQVGDGKAFGLDAPPLSVTWTTSKDASGGSASTGTLRISEKGPKDGQFYARIEGSPIVYSVAGATVAPFLAEFHDRRVLTFPADKVARLVLRWPDRSIPFARQTQPRGPARWIPEGGIVLPGFDLNRLTAFVASLSTLTTPRFLQYEGTIPASAALDRPRLAVEVVLEGAGGTRTLRLGNALPGKDFFEATAAPGPSGPVFILAGAAWDELVNSPPRPSYVLPDDPFAP